MCGNKNNMFCIEDNYMDRVLYIFFLLSSCREVREFFGEKLMATRNMKSKDMCQHFWDIYDRVAQEEVKNNKDRLTSAWQPHQGFQAFIAQIETCLVYGHFAKTIIPDKDVTDALLIVIKQTGHYQVRYDRLEVNPEAEWTNWKKKS